MIVAVRPELRVDVMATADAVESTVDVDNWSSVELEDSSSLDDEEEEEGRGDVVVVVVEVVVVEEDEGESERVIVWRGEVVVVETGVETGGFVSV